MLMSSRNDSMPLVNPALGAILHALAKFRCVPNQWANGRRFMHVRS